MKKFLTAVILSAGIIFCAAFGSFEVFADRCEDVRNEVIRLHIPANSNSDEDQSVKLALRDLLLERYGTELSGCMDKQTAEIQISELLPEIERVSNEFLEEQGFTYGAKAEFVTMYFPTREYDRLILPAGDYKALRVTLGSGEGNNWWCVIFPQLCLPAVSEADSAQSGAAEQVLCSFGKPQKITVKFALYEWLSQHINNG